MDAKDHWQQQYGSVVLRQKAISAIFFAFLFLISFSVDARPGFYIGLSPEAALVNGVAIPYEAFSPTDAGQVPRLYGNTLFSTDNGSGVGLNLRLGYNLRGYAAVEAVASGHGNNFGDSSARAWASHLHFGARVYPLWHWQGRLPKKWRDFEPSVFVGYGGSYQVYVPAPHGDEIGFSTWSSVRVGLAGEYFLADYFKVGVEYAQVGSPYDTFIFNISDSKTFPLDANQASATVHQLSLLLGFQFTPAGNVL